MSEKIILDTDLGGDVDDALALALCLNSPEIEILGITTVYLAAEWRKEIIKNILNVYERENIPVILGAEKPVNGFWNKTDIPGDYTEFSEECATQAAADFIVSEVMKQENLIIAAIGPLTNIALALMKEPHIANRCRILIMGGMISSARAEWNILCDPEAARAVFESGVPIQMVGLDVTEQCRFTREDIETVRAAGNEKTTMLAEMMDKFVIDFGYLPILHDPLAISTLLWPELLTFTKKTIAIETKGEYTRGVTVDETYRNGKTNALVATDVKADEVKEKIIGRLINL